MEYDVLPEGRAGLVNLLSAKGYEVLINTHKDLFMGLTRYKQEFFGNKIQ